MSSQEWWQKVNVKGISNDTRRRLLEVVKSKLGWTGTLQALGVGNATLHRYLAGESKIPDSAVAKMLPLITREEFEKTVSVEERLRALGIVREDGSIDYSLILGALSLASRDEYLRQAIFHFVAQNFRDELRRMLGMGFTGVKLTWTDDFEHFLTERKKGKKVRDPGTIAYYRSLFQEHLEGRELTRELAEQIAKAENGWLRIVFRHYVRYLFYKGDIDSGLYDWVMNFVPSRQYKLTQRSYPIGNEDVRRTLEFLREKHELYYAIYRAMLESGARLTHVLRLLAAWSPNERVPIEGLGLTTQRLVCFNDKGFCRYYCGFKGGTKSCEWAYMSRETVDMLAKAAGAKIDRRVVTKYAERHKLLLPKTMRKVAWEIMNKTLGYDTAAFLHSRFGELPVSALRYQNLLGEADERYPAYLAQLRALMASR